MKRPHLFQLKCFPHLIQKDNSNTLVGSILLKDQILKIEYILNYSSEIDAPAVRDFKKTPHKAPERLLGLWESTCFELFVSSDSSSYFEFNFSPLGDWNCFAFNSYREGMIESDIVKSIKILSSKSDHLNPKTSQLKNKNQLSVQVDMTLDFSKLTYKFLPKAAGPTAVWENSQGQKSYWALTHPLTDKPDFHLKEAWTIAL